MARFCVFFLLFTAFPVPLAAQWYVNPNFMGMADVSVNNRFALQGVLAH